MRSLRVLVMLLPVVTAVPAIAQTTPTAQAKSTPNDEEIVVTKELPAKKKRVCRMEMATGSIVTKRVCVTQEEAEAVTAQSMATLDQMKRDQEGIMNARRATMGCTYSGGRYTC